MKSPIYHRMFGYNTQLLPNSHLASLEYSVTSIEHARKKRAQRSDIQAGDLFIICYFRTLIVTKKKCLSKLERIGDARLLY